MKNTEALILVSVLVAIAVIAAMMMKQKTPQNTKPKSDDPQKREFKELLVRLSTRVDGSFIYGTVHTDYIEANDMKSQIKDDVRITVDNEDLFMTEYNVPYKKGMPLSSYAGPLSFDGFILDVTTLYPDAGINPPP